MKQLLFLLIVNLYLATPQDQAERLYDNAVTFMNAGKYKEAQTDFTTVIDSFGNTPWAAKALLQLGTYYLDVANDSTQALEYMNRLQKEHPTSEEAPAAYYYRALIASKEGQALSALEDATADLVRLNNLFPENPWRGAALYLYGELSLRLGDYKQSLSYFQRLEFSEPNSPFLKDAWMLSAWAAYFDGMPQQAALILARLQSHYPNSDEAAQAAALLRLLDRIRNGKASFSLDNTFFGAAPKRFSNPSELVVSENGTLAVMSQKTIDFANLADPSQTRSTAVGDLVTFARGGSPGVVFVYENRVVSEDGLVSFKSLSGSEGTLKDIISAAIDAFGRLFVVDGDARDLIAFDRSGKLLKSFNLNKAKLVRTFGAEALALASDGSTLKKYDANLNPVNSGISDLSQILDFRYDPFGNLYVLHDKGNSLSLYGFSNNQSVLISRLNLKSGSFPLKQAQSLAVDTSGAIYLADRRGGAVYRFQ